VIKEAKLWADKARKNSDASRSWLAAKAVAAGAQRRFGWGADFFRHLDRRTRQHAVRVAARGDVLLAREETAGADYCFEKAQFARAARLDGRVAVRRASAILSATRVCDEAVAAGGE